MVHKKVLVKANAGLVKANASLRLQYYGA
jgi:hypothetical protein